MGGNEGKTIIHCCIDKSIYDMLIRHCEETGQTKTMAIKRAIAAYCAPALENQDIQDNQDKQDDKSDE